VDITVDASAVVVNAGGEIPMELLLAADTESIPMFLIRVAFPARDIAGLGGCVALALSIWYSTRKDRDRQSGFECLLMAATAFLLSAAWQVIMSFRYMGGPPQPVWVVFLAWEAFLGTLLFPAFGIGLGLLLNLRCDKPLNRSARYLAAIPFIVLFDLLLTLVAVIGRFAYP
jgi:hypothetical protein